MISYGTAFNSCYEQPSVLLRFSKRSSWQLYYYPNSSSNHVACFVYGGMFINSFRPMPGIDLS